MFVAFNPQATVTVAATTASAAGQIRGPQSQSHYGVVVTAAPGGDIAFIKFGDSTVTATVNDMPILPGSVQSFRLTTSQTHIAAITASGTSTIYATYGNGA